MATISEHQTIPINVVREFVTLVRSGIDPDAAHRLMTATVTAHQVTSDSPRVLERTPENYAEHVREFKRDFGNFTLVVEELLAHEDKVYVRWRQTGTHNAPIMGHAPTGKPLVFVGSAIYRIQSGRICEYWIQQEWFGLLNQLERNAKSEN